MKIRNLQFKVFNVSEKRFISLPKDVTLMCFGENDLLTVRHGRELIYVQSTGLLDLHKKKIFDGDIAEFSVQNEFGSWEKKYGVMEMSAGGYWGFSFEAMYDFGTVSRPLVIGNRLTHPELLKLINKN